jgi:hypothetical protein
MKKRIIAGAFFLMVGLVSGSADQASAKISPDSGMHNILSTELPAALRTDIKKQYQGYWITGLFEEGMIKRPSYFITMENADQIIKMSSDDSENWVIISTIVKDN